MTTLSPSTWRILRGIAYGAAVLAPLFLLLDLSIAFPRDWLIHVWTIGYYGEYFRQHHDLPLVLNTTPAVGIALPAFYCCLLYPLLGIFAAFLGAGLALRLALLAMVAVQFYALMVAGRQTFGHARLAFMVAVSVIWATYSLTNLYSRGALAEYFGAGFFFTAIAFGAAAIGSLPGSTRTFRSWLAGVFLILAVGSHPPTAVLAGAFVALLLAGVAFAWSRSRVQIAGIPKWPLAALVLAGLLILGPWIYASASLGSQLNIASTMTFKFIPDHSDNIAARFSPFPSDMATTEEGIDDLMGAPYLEAPVNVVLLGLLGFNLWLLRRGRSRPEANAAGTAVPRALLAVSIGWFLFLAAVSVSPGLADVFHFAAPYIQYVYRLVSHCNAALLVGVFASGALVVRQGGYGRFQQETNLILAVGLTIAILGVWIKLQHSGVMAVPGGNTSRPTLIVGRQREMGRTYSTEDRTKDLVGQDARNSVGTGFPVGQAGAEFGETGPVRVNLKEAGWVRTNALYFPWVELRSDGEKIAASQLGRSDFFLAAHLPAGSHELRAVWQPDPVWLRLYRISQVAFAVLMVVTLAWAAARGWRAAALASGTS